MIFAFFSTIYFNSFYKMFYIIFLEINCVLFLGTKQKTIYKKSIIKCQVRNDAKTYIKKGIFFYI